MTDGAAPGNLQPGQWVDGFRVVKRLGGGSYGAVYQVEKGGHFFALKMALHREQSRDELHTDARTQRELACLLVLRHPHIARVWGHGRWPHPTEGYFYLVMDYVEGRTLAAWAEETSPTAHELAVVGEKAAAALAYMHGLGIFHRDIKPSNIMVRSSDGEPVLIDYGAAAFPLGPELTDRRLPPGTSRYTSPQALRFDREHRHDPSARYEFTASDDIYALGVTLYDVLTMPRLHSSTERLPVSNWFIPPTPAIQVNPRVPVALSQLVDQLIARDPEQRPASMEKARRSLAEFPPLEGEEWMQRTLHPPSAQAPQAVPPPRRVSFHRLRWLPRAAAATGAVGVLAVLLLLGLGMLRPGAPGPEAVAPVPPEPPGSPGPETKPIASPSPRVSPPSAPVPAEPEPTPPPAPPPAKKGSPVTTSGPLSNSSEALCQRTSPPPRGSKEFRQWCQCATLVGTLAAANAGCAGAPVRPDPGRCPQEAQDAMVQALRIKLKTTVGYIALDTEPAPEDPYEQEYVAIKEGPITATVIRANDPTWPAGLPKGTLLHGYLWTDLGFKRTHPATGELVEFALIRFTSVTLPNKKSYPACIVAFDEDGLAVKHAGSRPGVAVVQRFGYINTVRTWPPPPGPLPEDG
ncbi:MAG TPA: serine/threonine-protein kinase [Myxococcaceae bacterium]